MIMTKQDLWKKCVEFHGHECGGLTIGYKAALYAIDLLNIAFSEDESIVCISENDACSVDAIQVILGCSLGKGNLLFHMTGKQAYSIYERNSGKSIRLVLKKQPVKETTILLPERARIFSSHACECCGETAGDNWIRVQEGKSYCLDCYEQYDRFKV